MTNWTLVLMIPLIVGCAWLARVLIERDIRIRAASDEVHLGQKEETAE